LDPLQHPFARARERIRALNAAKMERMFSKPFIAALEGHADAVEALARRPNSITDVASASWDGGETRLSSPPQTFVRTAEQTSLFITLGGGRTSRKSQARIRGRYPAFAGLTTREY
jgi:hypothetical protein